MAASCDDGPRELFLLVPFVGGGANYVLGEAVDPLLDVLLVLVQLEAERRLFVRSPDLFLEYFF